MGTRIEIADVRANLGRRISQLRIDQNLSQYKFAAMIEIERTYLIDVEKGRRNVSVDNLVKIASGLGITLSELFENVDG